MLHRKSDLHLVEIWASLGSGTTDQADSEGVGCHDESYPIFMFPDKGQDEAKISGSASHTSDENDFIVLPSTTSTNLYLHVVLPELKYLQQKVDL